MGDKQLYKIFLIRKFYHLYELEENVTLILNSLSVWTIKDGSFCSKVDFDIFTDNDQKRYISPRYNPNHCDYFVLMGERLCMGRLITTDKDKYYGRNESILLTF